MAGIHGGFLPYKKNPVPPRGGSEKNGAQWLIYEGVARRTFPRLHNRRLNKPANSTYLAEYFKHIIQELFSVMRSSWAGIFHPPPARTIVFAFWSVGPGCRDKRLH